MKMVRLPKAILDEAGLLFEDVSPEAVDPEVHADFVIARVLDRGTLASVAGLVRFYGADRLRRFFREGGARQLQRRTVPLWAAFLNLTQDECTPRSSAHGRSPYWTD